MTLLYQSIIYQLIFYNMKSIFNRKGIVAISLFFFMLTIAVSLFAKNNEIVYDLFNVEINGHFCENCGSNFWHVDIPDDNPYHPGNQSMACADYDNLNVVVVLPVLNLRCAVCYSEFHFDEPIPFECEF